MEKNGGPWPPSSDGPAYAILVLQWCIEKEWIVDPSTTSSAAFYSFYSGSEANCGRQVVPLWLRALFPLNQCLKNYAAIFK